MGALSAAALQPFQLFGIERAANLGRDIKCELSPRWRGRVRKVTHLLGPYSEGPSVEETGCHLGARQSSVSWTSISHLTSPEGQESVFEHTP
jgi:hypothetical protein